MKGEVIMDLLGPREIILDWRYYISDFTCEMPPCDCTLDGWAKWLSGDKNFLYPCQNPPDDGARFDGYATAYTELSAARNKDGSYDFAEAPDGFVFHAVKYGKGAGWPPDYLVDSRAAAQKMLQEQGTEPFEYLALRLAKEHRGTFTFHAGTPPAVSFWFGEEDAS